MTPPLEAIEAPRVMYNHRNLLYKVSLVGIIHIIFG